MLTLEMAHEGYWERLLKEVIIREIERQSLPTPTDDQWAEVWRAVQRRRLQEKKSRRRRYLVAAAVLVFLLAGVPAVFYPDGIAGWARQVLGLAQGRDTIVNEGQEGSSALPRITQGAPKITLDQQGPLAAAAPEAGRALRAELEDKEFPFAVKLPAYLPPGFELKGVEVDPAETEGADVGRVRLLYGKGSQTVEILQTRAAEEGSAFSVGPGAQEEIITVEGREARLTSDGHSYTLYFQDKDQVAVQVKGNIAKEDIIRIAASLGKAPGPAQE
ncbi:MAG: DUF4367 domain-containing protein [Thermoanaerobacteraceae bacterium]|nr:DUF4367 domain-containing protein [Thermoanaerobacteraceae bacterium]